MENNNDSNYAGQTSGKTITGGYLIPPTFFNIPLKGVAKLKAFIMRKPLYTEVPFEQRLRELLLNNRKQESLEGVKIIPPHDH